MTLKDKYVHINIIDGEVIKTKVNYTVVLNKSKLKVFNEYNNSVEENSFIFEYFFKQVH